jgi:bifunctional non-homologous end joining protein LigD
MGSVADVVASNDEPVQPRRAAAGTRATRSRTAVAEPTTAVAGIRISHPDRVIYPELALSKLQLAQYYDTIGKWILPHVQGRPLTLVHCPAGIAGPCSYLRHAKAWGPTALRRVRIREKTKIGEYLVADSIPAVVALAQMGIVEIHTWNSTAGDIERPNRIVWDLDPGPQVAWKQVITAAKQLRDVLHTLGLASWVKTTGGKGLHVVVPIDPRRDWSQCLAFSRHVGELLARMDPAVYTTAFPKRGRERKILVDYLRNNRTNTSVCAFSPRARPGGVVSMPLDWKDLAFGPERWTLLSAPARLRRLRTDPWAGYWKASQQISETAVRALADMSSR